MNLVLRYSHQSYSNLQVILAGVIRESGLSEKNTRGDARMRTLLRSVQRFGTVKLEKDAIDSYIKQLDDTVKLFQVCTPTLSLIFAYFLSTDIDRTSHGLCFG